MGIIRAAVAASILAAAGAAFAQPYTVLGGTPYSLMTDKDREIFDAALIKALEQGKREEISQWSNPDSGASGTLQPTRDFTRGDRKCRDVYTETRARGRHEKGTWAFCRDGAGGWKLAPGADAK